MRNWTTKLGKPGDTADIRRKSVSEKDFQQNKIYKVEKRKQKKKKIAYTSYTCDLPSSPVFSPHFGFIVLVWLEVFTVETVAGINLSHDQELQVQVREKCQEALLVENNSLSS